MKINTRGVHHMAFLARDMDETVRFYSEIMGFPIVVTLQLPDSDPFPGIVPGDLGGAKHYFFDIGNGDRLAFFWCPKDKLPDNFARIGAGNHLAFALGSIAELDAAESYLKERGVQIKSRVDHTFCQSIYFDDPNGITLELSVYQHPCTPEQPFLQDATPTPATLKHLGAKQEKFLLHFDEGNATVLEREGGRISAPEL
ncbi:MAG: VOC family protein [Candidatus Binataceae bacterium]